MLARKYALLGVMLALLAGVWVVPAVAQSTLTVSPGGTATCPSTGPFGSIQDAIDCASAGDTINVAAGTYTTATATGIDINVANLTINGPNAGIDPNTGTRGPEAIIDVNITPTGEGEDAIDVLANNVVLDGLTFSEPTLYTSQTYYLKFEGGSDGSIVRNSRFIGPGDWNNATNGFNYAMFSVGGATNITATNNFIDGWRQAWFLGSSGGTGSTFSNNVVTGVKGGVVALSQDNLMVTNNNMTGAPGLNPDDSSGIVLAAGSTGSVTITGNTLSNFTEGGVKLQDNGVSMDITMNGNTFNNNTNAIFVQEQPGTPQEFGPDTYTNNDNILKNTTGDPLPIEIDAITDDPNCSVDGVDTGINCSTSPLPVTPTDDGGSSAPGAPGPITYTGANSPLGNASFRLVDGTSVFFDATSGIITVNSAGGTRTVGFPARITDNLDGTLNVFDATGNAFIDRQIIVGEGVSMPTTPPTTGTSSDDGYRSVTGCSIMTDNPVNLRAEPTVNSADLDDVPFMTQHGVSRVASIPGDPNSPWYEITFNGQAGWVAGAFVTPSGSC